MPRNHTFKSQRARVYENLDQNVIHITADRAHRCLDEWRRRIEAKSSWVAPLSLAAALLARLTADFKDKFNVPKEYWAAPCFVGFLAAMFWLVRNVIRSMRNTPESSDQIVEKLKGKETKRVTELQEQIDQF